MQASFLDYVHNARERWEEGYAYVAALLNQTLRRQGVTIHAPDPLPNLKLRQFRQRLLNAITGIRPFVIELPADSDLLPWSLGYVNGRENPLIVVGGGMYPDDASIEPVLEFLGGRDWPSERWHSEIIVGVGVWSSVWLDFFDDMEGDADVPPRPPAVMPDDPVTIKEMAMATLGVLTEDAVRNWPTADRPAPAIPNSGRRAAVFSYAIIRPWFISKRPDLSGYWPESFRDFSQALRERV